MLTSRDKRENVSRRRRCAEWNYSGRERQTKVETENVSRRRAEWNYCGRGPSTWHEQYPVAKGQRQSPIDIVTDKVEFDRTLSDNPLNISYSNNCCQSVTNTGASFQVAVDGTGTEISGGPLDNTYELVQFHAHWGHGGNEGSEHTVDGVTYPAELHLVHWNTKYKDVTEALDKADGLAVIGIFFTEGKEHAGFKSVSDLFSKVPRKTDKVDIKFKFNPACLLPAGRDYWTYLGSLTTPPLFESVTWIVMKDPVEVLVFRQSRFSDNWLGTTPSKWKPQPGFY